MGMGRYAATRFHPHPLPNPPLEGEGIGVVSNEKWNYLTTESRKPILNLALAMQQRAWMQGLWDASKTFDLPAKFTPIYSP